MYKATSYWRQNKLSATNAFKLVYSFSLKHAPGQRIF